MINTAENKHREQGFTLVEVLVALTLFSLILTMIFSGLHSSGRSWERGEAQIEDNDNLRLELGFIRKQLAQAVPLVLLDGKENPILFKGEPDAIHFTSRLPGHRGGGLFLLSLNAIEHEQDSDLQLSYRPITADIDLDNLDETVDLKTLTLMTDIDSLEFSYFGSEEEDTEPDWFNEWQAQRNLPELVRIRIEPVDIDRYLPDMIIKLHTPSARGQPQLTLYKEDQGMNAGMEIDATARAVGNSEVAE